MDTQAKIWTAVLVVVLLGIGMVAGVEMFPKTVTQTVTVPGPSQTVEVPGPVQYVNQTVQVPVDNGKLAEVEQFVYDNNGNVSFLTDGMTSSQVSTLADRIDFVKQSKSEAVDAVYSNAADLLNREDVTTSNGTVELFRQDITDLRVQHDDQQIVVDSIDFDYQDADYDVTATFRQNDESFSAVFRVSFRDGVWSDTELVSVSG